MWGVLLSSLLPFECAGEVMGSGGSRSRVYWFLPTRPRFAGGRPVFLWDGLGSGGVGVATVGSGASGFEGAGSGEGSESGLIVSLLCMDEVKTTDRRLFVALSALYVWRLPLRALVPASPLVHAVLCYGDSELQHLEFCFAPLAAWSPYHSHRQKRHLGGESCFQRETRRTWFVGVSCLLHA